MELTSYQVDLCLVLWCYRFSKISVIVCSTNICHLKTEIQCWNEYESD